MSKDLNIWLVGNTGLRNPERIKDGFEVFSQSPFIGNIRGKDNEIQFMRLLDQKGIIKNQSGKDISGSHARKWRLMFEKNGFIYPKLSVKNAKQEDLGSLDEITPFGYSFLSADTVPAIQEHFLRSLSAEQNQINEKDHFSPLKWFLAILLKLQEKTGSSEISRIEFALWVQTTNPSNDINQVVNSILDLRERRNKAKSKLKFDQKEIKKRSQNYKNKSSNFLDYADMNMRYFRITGLFKRKGRGLMVDPLKLSLVKELASDEFSRIPILEVYEKLCNGTPLPTDDKKIASKLLSDLQKQLSQRHLYYDLSDLKLENALNINTARYRLEEILLENNEISYAENQINQWEEIVQYMDLLINNSTKFENYEQDYLIEIPSEERPAYLEWIIWRAMLAIDKLKNQPYESRGFLIDSDFLPISTAPGNKSDLYLEYENFVILIEVTLSSSSRQEAMEGESVRRHVWDAIMKYDKPIFGLFIAPNIDTNTAETFRHSIWYDQNEIKQRLNIVPLDLNIFKQYFIAMFETNNIDITLLLQLFKEILKNRDLFEAPDWKKTIVKIVNNKINEMYNQSKNVE